MSVKRSIARPGVMVLMAAILLAVLPNIGDPLEKNLTLPDIQGWNKGEGTTTVLDSPSGNQGVWLELIYSRKTDRHSVLVVVMQGPGTAWSGLPKGDVSDDDGPIGSGVTYRTTTVLGFPAALEIHPLTGRTLVVAPAEDATFTFETAFNDVDLEGFAKEILKGVNGESQGPGLVIPNATDEVP
ncbi:MAG: hypothetical protein Q7I97_01480 [Thermovirgaceae bacterium]|nr:hypothetical protein [Thermovirgaceae bacterium]